MENTNKIINVTVIGHVDCGKSTLCGQLLLSCGLVSEQDILKLKMIAKENKLESWYLAYLTDTSQEERTKGKTVDYSINSIDINNIKINLIDTPGHKNYISNTMTGLQISDIAILVVSAKDGEFESGFEKCGQTKEHLIVAKGSNINNIIVAINKIDEKGVNEERIEYIKNKISEYVKQIGVNVLEYVNISALKGENIIKCENNINEKVLIDEIIKYTDKMEYKNDNQLKMLIIEKYKDMGNYLVVKIISGNLFNNNLLINNKENINILKIYNKNYDEINKGLNNDIVIIKTKEDIGEIGEVITENEILINNVKKTMIKIINSTDNIPIITKGYKMFIEYNLKSIESEIMNIENKNYLRVGNTGKVLIKMNKDIYNNINDNFIIRNEGKIIGIGKFL